MNDRALEPINEFIVELVNTRKFLQFYPSNNSRVRDSLARLYRNFRRLVDGEGPERPVTPDGLLLTVERREIRYGVHALGRGFKPVDRLATDLYKLHVKSVHLMPDATRVDFQFFLDATCMKPESILAEGGLEQILRAANVRGIRVGSPEQIAIEAAQAPFEMPMNGGGGVDMLGYLRSAQALRQFEEGDAPGEDEEAADLTELLDFFSDITTGSEEKMSYFMQTLAEPDRLRQALEHIYQVDSARSRKSGDHRSLDVLQKSFHQMLGNIKGFSPDVRAEYARNIAMAVLSSSPDVQSSLIKDSLASEIGQSEVADAVLALLPDADVAEALLHSVRFHQGTANTISNFLDEFAVDPRRRSAISRLLTRLSTDDDTASVNEILALLSTEAGVHANAPAPEIYRRADSDIDHNARLGLTRLMDLEEDELDRIEESVEADFHLRTPYHAARTLLELYIQPTIEGVSKRTSQRLNQQLTEVLADGGYEYLADLVGTIERELPATAQVRVRAELEHALTECGYPEHLNKIFSKMRKSGVRSYEYSQLLALLDHLGERAIEHLFLRLEMENSRSMRMFFLELFRRLGEKSLPLLHRKMRHKDWYVVRNVVFILGSLGTERATDMLIDLLDHEDMRVRREVVRAIAKIGGATAETALIRLLDDDEPAMRRLSAEWLGFVGCARALPDLRAHLTGASAHDLDTLIGLVRAVGRLGNHEDAALVRRVVPRRGLFSTEKKRDLIQAGKEAMERLQGQRVPAGV